MHEKSRVVSGYLKELRQTKKEKPDQIKEALEIYIQLWERVIEKGLIRPDDDIDEALKKIDANGGLYHAADD
ncbi:MAG: hypothetical protein OK474_09100 [Thaumarchaeota archaeon]|nr:hypothetical protein [Nitrososphaerota archaeon]